MRVSMMVLALLIPVAARGQQGPVADGMVAVGALGAFEHAQGLRQQDTSQLVLRRVWSGAQARPIGGLSPDGRYITFVDSRSDLALRDMRTGEVKYLTNRRAGDPRGGYVDYAVVSHDGKRVAYHWYLGHRAWELHVVDIDGSNRRVLVDQAVWTMPLDWTPDGRGILVMLRRDNDASTAIALVSASDGSVRVLKEFTQGGGDARFSSDGRYVVYDMEVPGESQRDIFILSVADRRERTLIENPANDRLLGWVPGTDYVLFASDRTGTDGAWVVRVTDGRPVGPPTLVKPDLWRAWPVGFTGDGAFYYGVGVSTRGIYLATIDPATSRMLGEPTMIDPRQVGNSRRPHWSPDGRNLSYLKGNGDGPQAQRIGIRSMETGETREIDVKQQGGCPARWSPDARYFLLCGYDGSGQAAVLRIDVQTGETVPLKVFANNGASYWNDWAPDGKTVYYRVDYGRESRIEALDLETGTVRTLRTADPPDWIVMTWVDVSPDGRHIAFWEWHGMARPEGGRTDRLLVIPTSAAESETPARELLAVDFRPGDNSRRGYVRWSRDGRYVMYQVSAGDSARLWRVPATGGNPEPLELVLGWGNDAQFSPDGHRIAFDAGESSSEIWVMQNYLPKNGTKD